MATNVFKVCVIQYWLYDVWLDPAGRPCARDAPSAKFVKARRVPKGTLGAKKVKKRSGKWYGRVPGERKLIPLSSNKVAAQQMLAEIVHKSALAKVGISDPFEAHRQRPLVDHLAEWE